MYQFTIPTTRPLLFTEQFSIPDKNYLSSFSQFFSETSGKREELRAILKIGKNDKSADYARILESLENYLSNLIGLVQLQQNGQILVNSNFETTWRCSISDEEIRSNITKGFSRPKISSHLWNYELLSTLMCYGYLYFNFAFEQIDSNNDSKQTENRYNKAADLFLLASGIFTYVNQNLCPFWDLQKSIPLSANRQSSLALAKISLAQAQLMAYQKAQLSQLSDGLATKLLLGVVSLFEAAVGLIKSLEPSALDKWCPKLIKYVEENAYLYRAIAYRHLAKQSYDQNKISEALALVLEAKKLIKSVSGFKFSVISESFLSEEMNELKRLEQFYVKLNDTVSFQSQVSSQEILKIIPAPRIILDPKVFVLPKMKLPDSNADDHDLYEQQMMGQYALKGAYY